MIRGRNGFGRDISRVLSRFLNGENHLSAQPIPETRFAFAKHGAGSSGVSYLALHPMGFSVPRRLRFARCALTAPFHHHRQFAPAAVCFLWHCPSRVLALSRVYPRSIARLRGIAPSGVRTFLPALSKIGKSPGFRQFQKGLGDSPPFQNHCYSIGKLRFFKSIVLKRTRWMHLSFYAQNRLPLIGLGFLLYLTANRSRLRRLECAAGRRHYAGGRTP
jgi:hypothetical protein